MPKKGNTNPMPAPVDALTAEQEERARLEGAQDRRHIDQLKVILRGLRKHYGNALFVIAWNEFAAEGESGPRETVMVHEDVQARLEAPGTPLDGSVDILNRVRPATAPREDKEFF